MPEPPSLAPPPNPNDPAPAQSLKEEIASPSSTVPVAAPAAAAAPEATAPSARFTLSSTELSEMMRLKKQFESQQNLVGSRVGGLAKTFAERAAALCGEYERELRALVVACGVAPAIADAIVASESKRIDASDARPAAAFAAAPLRASVMRELGAQQFGSIERFETEKRIIYAQAVIRGWLVRKRFRNLVNRQKRREHAAKELLSTERTYADGLRIMVECYIQPFAMLTDTAKQIISTNDIKILFSNCRQLSFFHTQMLAKLTDRLSEYNATTTRLGDVFVELAPFFKVYQEYVNNYDSAQKHLLELKKNNARFAETLADIEKSPASAGKDLLSYLITPVQRVPRYEMMLAEIVKLTPDEHVDSEALRTALAGIKKAAVGINEAKRKAESSQRMTNLTQQLQGVPAKFHLLQPHRRYLFEGMLMIKDDKQLKEVLLFLFNDVLIVGRPKSKFAVTNIANAISNNEFRYSDFVQCKLIIKLETCQVSVGGTKELSRALDIRHGANLDKHLLCYTDDAADIVAWQQRLQAAIQAHMEQLAKSTLRTRGGDDDFDEYDADDDAVVRTDSTSGLPPASELYRSSSSSSRGGGDPADLAYLQRGKLRDVIRLYEEALKLQDSIFDLPIHLKTLWPQYEQMVNADHLQHVRARVNMLKAKLGEIDGRRDRVVLLLKHERLGVTLHRTLAAGVTPLDAVRQAVASGARVEEPVVLSLLNWYLSLCRTWQELVDLPIQ